MLLDLLGANKPTITSSHSNTNPWFKKIMQIEEEVTQNGLVRQSVNRHRIFRDRTRLGGLLGLLGGGGIDDDHKPFERRGKKMNHFFYVRAKFRIGFYRCAYFAYHLLAFSGCVAYQ